VTTEKSQREGKIHNNSSGRKCEVGKRSKEEIIGATEKRRVKRKSKHLRLKQGRPHPLRNLGE